MEKRVYTQTAVVVGAILEKDGKFLLVKEAGGAEIGTWNQPAGWIDVGSNPFDMVKVEVVEETGLEFEPKAVVGIYSLAKKLPNHGELRHSVKIIYSGKFSGTANQYHTDEIAEVRWFTPEEIENLGEQLRDKDIIQEIKDYLAGNLYPLNIIKHVKQVRSHGQLEEAKE